MEDLKYLGNVMKKDKKNISGIGGWLAFFIATLFLIPLHTLYNFFTLDLSILGSIGNYPLLKIFTIIYFLALIGVNALAVYSGVQLFMERPNAIFLVKKFLTSYIIFRFFECVYIYTLSYILNGLTKIEFFGILILSQFLPSLIFYYGAWMLYLKRSKRVANTYNIKLKKYRLDFR